MIGEVRLTVLSLLNGGPGGELDVGGEVGGFGSPLGLGRRDECHFAGKHCGCFSDCCRCKVLRMLWA